MSASPATAVRTLLGLAPSDVVLRTGSGVLPIETGGGGDLDFLVVTDPDRVEAARAHADTERLSEQLLNGFAMCYVPFGDEEIDVEVWGWDTVRTAAARIGPGRADVHDLEKDFTRFAGLERKVGVDLFHALLLGEADADGAAEHARLRASVDWDVYFAWNRDWHLVNVRDAVKGVTRSLRDNVDEAYMKMCWAADNLADAMVFHHGLSMNRWKWRLRYLDLFDPAVGAFYREVRFASPPSRDAYGPWLDHLRASLALFGTAPASLPAAAVATPATV